MERAFGTYNFEMAPRFWENVCTFAYGYKLSLIINTPTCFGQLDHHQGDNYMNFSGNNKELLQFLLCIKRHTFKDSKFYPCV
jgi:hypothetical protein